MKVKKSFVLYIAVWALLVGLFNLVTFIIPADTKYTNSFWIGYAFIMVAFVGQLVCSLAVFNQDDSKKVFYNLSLLQASFTGLIATFVAGILCMIIPFPYWLSVIICAVVLVFNAIIVIKSKFAVDAVADIDKKIKVQTFFIKSLTIDAETLTSRIVDPELKAECRKVAEALRYSDPMSNDALAASESQITLKFAALSGAVDANNKELAINTAAELLILIADRNKKCMLLK